MDSPKRMTFVQGYLTAPGASVMERTETGECSGSMEQQIEQSWRHWSLMTESGGDDEGEEEAETIEVSTFFKFKRKNWVQMESFFSLR